MLLRTWAVPLAATLSLTLAAGCTSEQTSGGLLGEPTAVAAPAPPSLGDGPIQQIATHGQTDPDADLDLSADGVLETEDLILVITQPDNNLAAYARDTAQEVWRLELPRDETTEHGACFGPRLTAPDRVTVFIGTGCALMMTYDLATGALKGKETVIDKYIMPDGTTQTDPSPDAYYPVEADIQGAVDLDGRVWFLTRDFLGYVDDDGKPVRVLEPAALGIGGELRNHVFGIGLGSRPEDHQLVVGMLHSKASQDVSEHQWRGVTIDDPAAGKDDPDLRSQKPTATPVWFLDETKPSSLGIPDLRPRNAPVLLRTEDPGTPLAVGLTGNRVGLARIDAATGTVGAVAVVPPGRETSMTDAESYDFPTIAWADGVLFTTSGAAGASVVDRRGLDAYDVTDGTQRWHIELPSPPNVDKQDSHVRSIQIAGDGSLYAVIGDGFEESTLHRVDPETGEVTQSWELPTSVGDRDYELTVAGDLIIALSHSSYEKVTSMIMLSNNEKHLQSPGSTPAPSPGTTPPSSP